MNQTLIFFPVLTLVGWTMVVLSMIGFRRITSRLHPREFALGESVAVPANVSLPNRNFMNLLEVPVLFYIVCTIYYVTARTDSTALTLAWVFVGLRMGHTLVHLVYNNVMHRLAFFALANFTLLGLWGLLLSRL